ncbi:hypothetical protein [Nonomuraea sp. NPDC049625]|uniref:hypothetical protein n=1 Tax=Nonomuraea sp. NPDC049625 TaxID=3155775 RepID=UPI00343866CB
MIRLPPQLSTALYGTAIIPELEAPPEALLVGEWNGRVGDMDVRRSFWYQFGSAFFFVFCGWSGAGAAFGLSGFRGPMPDAWLTGMWVFLSLGILLKLVAGVVYLARKRNGQDAKDGEVVG